MIKYQPPRKRFAAAGSRPAVMDRAAAFFAKPPVTEYLEPSSLPTETVGHYATLGSHPVLGREGDVKMLTELEPKDDSVTMYPEYNNANVNFVPWYDTKPLYDEYMKRVDTLRRKRAYGWKKNRFLTGLYKYYY